VDSYDVSKLHFPQDRRCCEQPKPVAVLLDRERSSPRFVLGRAWLAPFAICFAGSCHGACLTRTVSRSPAEVSSLGDRPSRPRHRGDQRAQ